MNIIFLGKTFTNISTSRHNLSFVSAELPLLTIKIYNDIIYFNTRIDLSDQCIFKVSNYLIKNLRKDHVLIQKILDEQTNAFIKAVAKTRDHCAKLTEGYSSIINGLDLFV